MSADLLARLIEAGTPAALVAEVAMLAARAEAAAEGDPVADRRRAWDRDYRAVKRAEAKAAQGIVSGGSGGCRVDNADVGADPAPSPLPSPDTPNQPPAPTRTGTTRTREAAHLPDGWEPGALGAGTNAARIVANRGEGWAAKALESFRNHWRSANGPNARKRDWQATWANWIIEQDNRDGRRGGTERVAGNDRPRSGMGRTIDAAQLALQRRAARAGGQ